MTMLSESVTLPHGLWREGIRIQEARVRPLSGIDEALVLDLRQATCAQRTTALLSRCVEGLGESAELLPGDVRRLCAGDREALMLHLHRATFGERLEGTLLCPGAECGRPMEVNLDARTLLLPPYETAAEKYDLHFTVGNDQIEASFRLPNGADLEAAAELASTDPAGAEAVLLRRCVERVVGSDGDLDFRDLPAGFADELGRLLVALDPQAELVLNLSCPECGTPSSTVFDASDFVLEEIAAHGRRLFQEVHILALRYGWSESEILGLSGHRRRGYLELLAEEGESGAE